MKEKAYFHLPGLFEFYELYRMFLPLFREHREYFIILMLQDFPIFCQIIHEKFKRIITYLGTSVFRIFV